MNLDLSRFSVNFFRMSDVAKIGRNGTDVKQDALSELHAEGDEELWYAEGTVNDKVWRFPLRIFWRVNPVSGAKYALIHPALCPYPKQQLYLQAMLEIHNHIPRTDRWLIRAELVGAILKKAPGVTAKMYYKWEDGSKRPEPLPIPPILLPEVKHPEFVSSEFGHERKLVSRIAERQGIPTTVVKTVLLGLNEVAAEHMIVDGKPLDLGFVKLIAVPYRGNWKEIICFRLGKRRLKKYLRDGSEQSLAHLTDNGFPEMLCSPLNIGLKHVAKGTLKRIDCSIEVITSKAFEKQVNVIEARRKAPGGANYVRIFEKRVEQLYHEIIEILQAYLKKVDLPFARIYERGGTGVPGFAQTRGIYAKAHGLNLRQLPVYIIPPRTGFSAFAGQSDLALLHPPAPEVQELPDLQREENDVWDGIEHGELGELDDGPRRSDRLSVSHAAEGAAAGEPVLLGPETGRASSWVDW